MLRKGSALACFLFVVALILSGCGGLSTPAAVSVAVTASSTTVDAADSVTLTAVVSNDKNAAGVTWTVSGGGALSNTTTTSATYTAPAASSTALTVTITATSVSDSTKIGTATITVPAKPTITTGALAAAAVGTAYSATMAGSGGISPYTWTITSGTLPAGLAMNSAGVISGTPTAAGVGSTNLTFLLTDSGRATALTSTVILGLTVNAAPAISFGGSVPATATYNTAYTGSASASGGAGALTYSLAGGSLPTGLSLNSATGAITGSPTAVSTFSFSVMAADAFGDTKTQGYSITVNPATPVLTFAAIPAHIYGDASFTVSASSASSGAVTYSVTSGPATIVGNTVTITGVGTVVLGASQAATTNYTTATGSTSFTVNPKTPTLAFAAIATHTFGDVPFTVSATSASSGAVTYSVTSGPATVAGNLVTLTGGGTVVLGASQAANGNYGTATTSTSFTVNPAVSITTPATLPSGTVSSLYSQTLAATGGSGTFTNWIVTAGATQLTALNLSLSTGGVLSGTPAASGSAAFTVQVTDSQSHTATASFTVTIYAALTVTTTTLPATNVGVAYSQQLAAAGGTGTGYTWTATTSNLSTYGLSLSTGGLITGTPTQAGTASFTANVKDSNNNTAPKALTIAVYSALSLPTPDPSSLPSTGYTNVAYTGTIVASGGSGNYAWQVTGLSDNLISSAAGNTLTISGTPGASPATVTFTVKLTDSTTGNSVTQGSYTVTISTPTPVTLPTPSSTIPGTATQNQSYNGTITVTGGVSPYTWSINGTTVTAGGVALGNSLTASSSGGSSLTISGTPTTTTTVNLTNVKVTDSIGSNQTSSYSIAVNSAGSNISGQVFLNNNCNGTTIPTITLTLTTNPGGSVVQTQTTDSSGNYTFTTIPNGTYTITPSIAGPSSVFTPAAQNVTVNNSAITGRIFNALLGYTVSGNASYGGAITGRVYLTLNSNCGGSGGNGTSLAAPGAFSIRGVAPGTYTLKAWMDPTALAEGAQNTVDPVGSAAVTVTNANVTSAAVALTDNTPSAVPTSNPNFGAISPTDQGVGVTFQPVTTTVNGNDVESVTSYDLRWSTSSTFATSPVTYNFKASGTHTNVWILNNSTSGITGTPFTNGTPYYFEVRSRNAVGPAATWTVYGGGTPIAVTPGTSTSGIQVQGTVTIPAGITPTGQLYVGFFNQNTKTIYGARIASPVVGANPYTVYVPSDASPDYINFAILDQNNNGLIDAGDPANTGDSTSSGLAITAPLTGQNPALPAVNTTALVTTHYVQVTSSSGTGSGYNLNFDLRATNKLPVAVTLTSGAHVVNPIDIGVCTNCGDPQFQFFAPLGPAVPTVGNAYNFTVTYSDGSQETGSTVNGVITAFGSTGAIVGASDLVTSLAPSGTSSTSVTPTFSWTYPAGASAANYLYSFYLADNNGNTIWQIPGNNGNVDGFTYAQDPTATLTWGTDPIPGDGSSPSGSLNTSLQYIWQIQVQDSNGNGATTQTWYKP